LEQQWLKAATTCPVCRQRVAFPEPTRRERGARPEHQPGPSRVADRSTLDIPREFREHVRMAFPSAVPRSDAGINGGGLEAGRVIEQEGDVDMPMGWAII
jgi:hypothetical protein